MGAVTDVDRGYKALTDRVFGFSKPTVHVGILDGSAPHGGADSAISILEVGIINEFGGGHTPARSFIRAWFDEHETDLRALLTRLMESVVAGKRTKEQILELIGQTAVAQIQERMAAGIAPENAPSTVKRKGSSTPLIDTGVLRSSIAYRVEEG